MSTVTVRRRVRTPMPSLVRQDTLTFEEFCDIIPEGVKADLLGGVIYVASPVNTDAADLTGWLAALLRAFIDKRDLGKLYIERVAYRLGPKHDPEPDIGFVPKELESTRRRGYIDGPPGLAIEIVTPDSVHRDYVLKREIYEEAGVREYWIIDLDERRATFLVLTKGRFQERKPLKNSWRSLIVPGFWIDVRWLWSDDRPPEYDILRRLLGEK